jgi:hypothetical protein
MRLPLLVLACGGLSRPTAAADTGDVYTYIGNGFCNDGKVPPSRVLTWMLQGACEGDSCCVLPACNGVVTDAKECAEICAETETCTGFMVQDNTMYGSGVSQVCQIVSAKAPEKAPTAFGFGWVGVKWDKDISAETGTVIGGHDTELRDRCYQRGESCGDLPPCLSGKEGSPYTTPAAPCCVELSSGWGWAFVISLLVGSTVYLAGFTGYNIKVHGKNGTAALPHPEFCEIPWHIHTHTRLQPLTHVLSVCAPAIACLSVCLPAWHCRGWFQGARRGWRAVDCTTSRERAQRRWQQWCGWRQAAGRLLLLLLFRRLLDSSSTAIGVRQHHRGRREQRTIACGGRQ